MASRYMPCMIDNVGFKIEFTDTGESHTILNYAPGGLLDCWGLAFKEWFPRVQLETLSVITGPILSYRTAYLRTDMTKRYEMCRYLMSHGADLPVVAYTDIALAAEALMLALRSLTALERFSAAIADLVGDANLI